MRRLLALLLLTFSIGSYSQNDSGLKENLTELSKKQVIDSLTKKLEEFYIRPNAVGDIKKKLNENVSNNKANSLLIFMKFYNLKLFVESCIFCYKRNHRYNVFDISNVIIYLIYQIYLYQLFFVLNFRIQKTQQILRNCWV